MTLLILFALALFFIFCRFTLVKEGTAKVIVRLGAFKKMVMAWDGYELDENWNVIESQRRRSLFGGLRFVGIWPFDRVFRYPFRWRDIQLEKGEEKVIPHEEIIDYIWLRPDVYYTVIEDAETRPPERIPLTVQWLVTMRVVNPYKALFKAPSNWNENVMSRLNSLFRDFVAHYSADQILIFKEGELNVLWNEFKDHHLIKMFEEEWGIKVEGIEIRKVDVPPKYQESLAEIARAQGRAQQIIGSVLQSVAIATGQKLEEVQKRFKRNPEEFYRTHQVLINNVMSKLSMEEKAYLRIETPGAEGALGDFLRLIGAWQRMPGSPEKSSPVKQDSLEDEGNCEEAEQLEEKEKEKSPSSDLGLLGGLIEFLTFIVTLFSTVYLTLWLLSLK
jgi:regulator of protease activity HflC (stomatin/prohibitin superfamily)